MEKFYVLDKGTPLEKHYWEYRTFQTKLCEIYKEFSEKHGIHSKKFRTTADRLWIVPDEIDQTVFKEQFITSKPGLFKKNSPNNKHWVKTCADNGVSQVDPPDIGVAFGFHKASYRLFHADENVYCTYECYEPFDTPDGFTELKASEFYKIMEANGINL